MTKAKPIQVDCTECRGRAGGPCLWQNGKPRKSFHKGRKEKAARTEAPLPKCSDCGATGSAPCRWQNGKPRKSPHPVRKRAARVGEAPPKSSLVKPSAAQLRSLDTVFPRRAIEKQQQAYATLGLTWSPEAIREGAKKWTGSRRRGGKATPDEA